MKTESSDVITAEYDKRMMRTNQGSGGMTSLSRTTQCYSTMNERTRIHRNRIPAASHRQTSLSYMRIRKGTDLTQIDMDIKKYGGNPTNEIKRLHQTGERLVSFSNENQMKCINVTVAKYNRCHKHKIGLKVKCRYDYNNLLILFYLSPTSQVSLEESQCDPEEPLCVPP